MYKIKYFLFSFLILFLSSTLVAQVENSAKEKKVKAEKQIEKVSNEVKSTNDIVKAESTKMQKKCGPDCKMACCSTETKEMESEMKKGVERMKQAHANISDCEGCQTASSTIYNNHNMLKKAHSAECGCEGAQW